MFKLICISEKQFVILYLNQNVFKKIFLLMFVYVNMDILCFQLFNIYYLENLLELLCFVDYDMEVIGIMLDVIKDFFDKEFYLVFCEMDEQLVYYDNGKIIIYFKLGKILWQVVELGLVGGIFNYDDGGLQLFFIIGIVIYFIMDVVNNNVVGYIGFIMGVVELILYFVLDEIKEIYVLYMISGDWGGMMCLMELQVGSLFFDIIIIVYL